MRQYLALLSVCLAFVGYSNGSLAAAGAKLSISVRGDTLNFDKTTPTPRLVLHQRTCPGG